MFESKRDEVTGDQRKLHNEELHNLYSLPCIVRVIKSRRVRLAGHVARMGERRILYRLLVGKQMERDNWDDQVVCGWTILKCILER
jgi:hypothetical protein